MQNLRLNLLVKAKPRSVGLPKLAALIFCGVLAEATWLTAQAQHIAESNRITGVEKLRGITGFAVHVRVNRKGSDYEDTQADARIKAALEKKMRAAGFAIYNDDDNYPVLMLQVFWDTETSVSGNVIGQSFGEILSVSRLLPMTKENNPAGKPYILLSFDTTYGKT